MTKNRPLLVVMKGKEATEIIFQKLSNLKNAPEKFRSLSIQHDQTKKREEEEELLNEAKREEERSSGEWVFRVRGPPWARRVMKLKPKREEG